jgi:tetratricopeptide (TPR) repeat protein
VSDGARGGIGTRALALVAGLALSVAAPATAQQGQGLSDAARQAVSAAYLTDDEKASARVFHGVWEEGDLDSVERLAFAALTVHAWGHPVFDDPATPAAYRAEALLRRGDAQAALDLLAGEESMRARRVRVEALLALGRMDEADAAVGPIAETLLRRGAPTAEELVEGVKALRVRARLRAAEAGDFELLMGLLAQARDELDRLYWPASLVEAQLLVEKDNRAQAVEAIEQTLSLNPSSAGAWALRAEMAVDGFNFDAMESAAKVLEAQAAGLPGWEGDAPAQVDAALARARSWMRQNEPVNALERLAPALEAYPTQRELLALAAGATAMTYDDAATRAALERFDELSPGSAQAHLAAGAALAEARQYALSEPYLLEAIERAPNLPEAHIELGLMYMQWGRDIEAHDALERAVALDPFHVRADNSLRLISELLTYERLEGAHFIVRFRPGVDRVMAEEMLPVLDRIHETVADELEHEPEVKTVIELMPNHEWFAVRITGMPALHTIAAATGSVIAMEAPKVGPDHSGVYDWARVVQHEYVHTVTLSRTKNRIPHWFTEAAAVHLEQAPRDYGTCRLLVGALTSGELFDMQAINIAFVRPEKPSDRGQAYAQGHWMYEFIVERWGAEAPLRLMDLYAEGVREEEAFRSVLGVPREDFFESFVAWAEDEARAWGMLPETTMDQIVLAETLADPDLRAGAEAALGAMASSAARAIGGAGRLTPAPVEMARLDPERVERLLETWGEHPDLLQLRAAQAKREAGDVVTEEVAHWLERYAQARPVDDEPHRLLAGYYRTKTDEASMRKATEHLAFLDAREQKSAAYAIELARLRSALGEQQGAWVSAVRATTIAPFDADYREVAAAVAIQRRDFDAAAQHIRALIALEPDRPRHQQRLDALERLRARSSG